MREEECSSSWERQRQNGCVDRGERDDHERMALSGAQEMMAEVKAVPVFVGCEHAEEEKEAGSTGQLDVDGEQTKSECGCEERATGLRAQTWQ